MTQSPPAIYLLAASAQLALALTYGCAAKAPTEHSASATTPPPAAEPPAEMSSGSGGGGGSSTPPQSPTPAEGGGAGAKEDSPTLGGTGGQTTLVVPAPPAGVAPAPQPTITPQPAPPRTSPATVTELTLPHPGQCTPPPSFKIKNPPEIAFSLERGWYTGNQTLTLTPVAEGATVTFAVGGGIPNKAYSGPITVTDNGGVVTVRARATVNGMPGRLQTHSFIFMPNRGGAAVVVTDNDLTAPPDEDEETVTFEFIPEPGSCLPSVAEEAGTAPNMGGSSAGASDKLYFRGEYGNGTLDADIFGDLYYGIRPTVHHDHLYLRADHTDWSFMRNIIAHDALLALGQFAIHGRFVDFFDNGKLVGTRYLHERPEGGFMESYTGIEKPQWLAVSGVDALGTILDERTHQFLSWSEVDLSINVHSMVDQMLVQWQAATSDYQPTRKNWRGTGPVALGEGPGTHYRWHFFNWDLDRGYRDDDQDQGLGSPMDVFERIEQFPPARFIMQDRVQCAFSPGGALTVPKMMERFNVRLQQLLTTSRVTENGKDLAGEVERLAMTLEPWLILRESYLMANHFTEESALFPEAVAVAVSANGVLTLSATAPGEIYFRLDGGDPRTLNGQLDPAAILYTEPVSLPVGQSSVLARVFNEAETDPYLRFSPACDTPRVFNVQPIQ